MKSIINKRMYNTETATCIADYWNGLSSNDFRNISESLYRKKTGEFFLCGNGGPLTKYRENVGNMWGSGSRIIPLSEEEAQDWCEEHLDADEYIELFGEVEE